MFKTFRKLNSSWKIAIPVRGVKTHMQKTVRLVRWDLSSVRALSYLYLVMHRFVVKKKRTLYEKNFNRK